MAASAVTPPFVFELYMRTRNHSGGLILCARALGRVHEQEVRSPLAHPASPAFAAIHYVHGAARPAAMGKGVQPRPPFANHPPDLRHPVLILPASQRTTVATFRPKAATCLTDDLSPTLSPSRNGRCRCQTQPSPLPRASSPRSSKGESHARRRSGLGLSCKDLLQARHARCCCDANATLGSAGTAASQPLAVGSQRPH